MTEWNRSDAVHRSKKAARVVLFLVTCMWLLTKLSAAAAKHIDTTYTFKLFQQPF